MVVSACRIGPRKRFFSEMKGGRFRLSRPLSGKAGSRSDHGAPAGLRAESRPDIRLVGTVTGRRFETPERWQESMGIAESKVAFFPADRPSFQRRSGVVATKRISGRDLRRHRICAAWRFSQRTRFPTVGK